MGKFEGFAILVKEGIYAALLRVTCFPSIEFRVFCSLEETIHASVNGQIILGLIEIIEPNQIPMLKHPSTVSGLLNNSPIMRLETSLEGKIELLHPIKGETRVDLASLQSVADGILRLSDFALDSGGKLGLLTRTQREVFKALADGQGFEEISKIRKTSVLNIKAISLRAFERLAIDFSWSEENVNRSAEEALMLAATHYLHEGTMVRI